jgi:hypothetical protein
VKYRGFFINDEAPALTGWMNSRYPKSQWGSAFGADFYSHVFELLLRLRANYLWPAMWGSMFNVDDPRNQALADEYGVVMGTSHTEPMMRATNEQTTFMKGPWQWNVNNASMYPFMKEGAIRAKGYESLFTMGARGNADGQLSSIISNQQKIITEVYGNETAVSQMWCLYKEVQGYYEEGGLSPPDYITLLWVDDNWGNIRRLPVGNETDRRGGAGVYYHFDYVGGPRNYKWINTIELTRTWEQMKFAYEREAQTIWIVNVGDIKPLEIPINHFFDLAYDITLYQSANSTNWWLQQWAAREFGASRAKDIADIVATYSHLAARRKYESIDTSTYSMINYEEGDKVLAEWQALGKRAQQVADALDDEYQAPFFEMVLHPVLAGGNVYDIIISSSKNYLFAQQGRNSANSLAEHVLDQWDYDHELTDQYNKLLNSKWNHMMDQTHFYNNYWQGPMRSLTPGLFYVQARERSLSGDLGVTIDANNGSVPGDDQYHSNGGASLTFPPIDPYMKNRWIDLYAQGLNSINWNISTEPHVKLTQSAGRLDPLGKNTDIRVYLSIDWTKAPKGSSTTRINVTSSTDYGTQYQPPYLVLPVNNTAIPSTFTSGFVESDGTVSIEAVHYSRKTTGGDLGYYQLDNYGKTLGGMALNNNLAPSQTAPSGPSLEYDFYTFTSTTSSKQANISFILGQSLNTNPHRPLQYAVAIDDGAVKTIQYIKDQSRGNTPVGWEKAVSDAAWVSTVGMAIAPGKHTLKFWALEPGVVLTKIVVDLGGVRKSYLGPPESYRVGA